MATQTPQHPPEEVQRAADVWATYDYPETRELVALVSDAAELIRIKGAAAFDAFRLEGSRWRQAETYIFVLDRNANMLVHPDAALEGKNQSGLKDVNGRPIIRGLIDAVTTFPEKTTGWYHYQWPVPGGLLPRWKSSFMQLATTPSGASYIVGSGMYNDRMERAFVVDVVTDAVARIEQDGAAAFPILRDPAGPFMAKNAYVFVVDPDGLGLVNPGFPILEGRNLIEWRDTTGRQPIREFVAVARASGAGWVDYMWPKPGESMSTQKSAYVRKAKFGTSWLAVGCGVYLADAPKAVLTTKRMTATELMAVVRAAAAELEARGEAAYPEFRQRGSKWFNDETYLFVQTLDGTRLFHATEPETEDQNLADWKDVAGRCVHRMLIDAVSSPAAEGWVHYMYPEPGNIFPTWKSAFARRVTFPSGEQRVVAAGVYNMQMDTAFIEDVVNRAADLVERRGISAFPQLRDKTGPFVFMDTYVFVTDEDGAELVNGAWPSLEGMNLIDIKDLAGKAVVRDEIAAAIAQGSAWLESYWYKPGSNLSALKRTYVRRVQSGQQTYIVGSGVYID